MQNIKDTLTTVAAVMAALAGAIFGIGAQGVILPAWLNTAAIVLGGLSVAIIGFLSGKLPNGTSKTPEQIEKANEGK
jgi:VIT1/CCC1 family predicted Fe2+/Mn2+ transporter